MNRTKELNYSGFSSNFFIHVSGMAPSMRDPIVKKRITMGSGLLVGVTLGNVVTQYLGSKLPKAVFYIALAFIAIMILSGLAKALVKPYVAVMGCDDMHFVINNDMTKWYCAASEDNKEQVRCLPILKVCEQIIEEENEYIVTGIPSIEYARHIKKAIKKSMLIWNVSYVELRIPKTDSVKETISPMLKYIEDPVN